MSAQASKAARELVDSLCGEGLLVWDSEGGLTSTESKHKAAEEIQAALSDLLEKARAVNDPDLKRFMALQEALDPWKAGE